MKLLKQYFDKGAFIKTKVWNDELVNYLQPLAKEILVSKSECKTFDKGIIFWSRLSIGIELGINKVFVSSMKIKEKEIATTPWIYKLI